MNNKKIIGIFVFYDKYGIVDDYIICLLESLQPYLENIIIVCNGYVDCIGIEKLQKLSDRIVFRNNIGFDSGAYKDILLQYWDEIEQYDDLLLFNSTFFGPIFSWNQMFQIVQEERPDFWGLLSSDEEKGENSRLPEFVHSFFFGFSNKVLRNEVFLNFWKNLEYPKNYFEACSFFELKLTKLLLDCGFTYKVLVKGEPNDICCSIPQYLLEKYQFPIVKYKALHILNYENMKETYSFINNNSFYDIQLIKNHMDRLFNDGGVGLINKKKLDKFLENHLNGIYIYGHAVFGKNIQKYLSDSGISIKAFIVTRKEYEDEIEFSEMKIEEGEGIIVGMGEIGYNEIKQVLYTKISQKDVFVLDYNGNN